ncbi:DnaT-like ssDNA-binding domain-containing protein [Thioflavicoccus mobilis]|uniref:DnaT-like ssDNA-binding domain-containing protein n=1 Tax=Thioflavicoccus mobilis TaxID=80679 RepID=UPI0009FC5741|nr:DnaT-like ssDNA-binding domain-containing protein [Thioflavicoccus mobilis]
MSRAARDWAWSRRGLTPAQRLVLLALAERANDRGDSCFPSLRQLEHVTELSRRGITKALAGLDGRLIERDRGGPRRSTRYRLLLTVPTEDERPSEDAERCSLPVGREQGSPGNSVPVGREQGSQGRECSSPPVGNRVPPNRHQNRHRTEHEPSLCGDAAPHPANAAGGSRGKCSRIQPDWRPSERVFAWATKQGIGRDWVEAQIDEFVVYWTDTGAVRKSWDATFINRLQALRTNQAKDRGHDPEPRLADKDYLTGATPLDQIPWLQPIAGR